MDPQIKISILIVTKNWNADLHAFNYIKELRHSNIDFEVLLAEGNNPSSQRNLLAKNAEGDYILFLDDDSMPVKDLLEIYHNTLLAYPETEILGGPSLLRTNESVIYQLSDVFFSNAFGIGPIRSRYNSLGSIRKASEKDLILCNLLMKRDFFLRTKGFNQNQYPGEENEFLKSLHASTNIIYDPRAIVTRKPRETFVLFLEQMFSYGKGRAKHLKLNYFFEYLFLIPLFFSLYIVSLPFLNNQTSFIYLPLWLHLSISMGVFAGKSGQHLSIYQKTLLPFFFLLGHFFYGLGLMAGVAKYKIAKKFIASKRPKEIIQLHKLKKFKKNYT